MRGGEYRGIGVGGVDGERRRRMSVGGPRGRLQIVDQMSERHNRRLVGHGDVRD